MSDATKAHEEWSGLPDPTDREYVDRVLSLDANNMSVPSLEEIVNLARRVLAEAPAVVKRLAEAEAERDALRADLARVKWERAEANAVASKERRRLFDALAKVAALEARLAELGPVVEAAERWSAADVAHGFAPSGTIAEQEQSTREMCAAEYDLREAVCALRVARAKREKGGAA